MRILLWVFLIIAPGVLDAQLVHRFIPTIYYRDFSSAIAPVLKINEKDTVTTTSVDAGGFDEKGVRVTERGNPLTGPFFIEGAEPGDVLAVTITELKLTRDYATTLNTLVPKVLSKKDARATWRSAKLVKWHLDTLNLIATPDKRYNQLENIQLPLHPFIGGIGLAPEGTTKLSTGASGITGGNLDCRFVTKGTAVYLPVKHRGALLMLGDGHAAQGDGELNGDALETTLRIGFTTRILKHQSDSIPTPLIETADSYMIMGIEKTLEAAMQTVTQKWVKWLQMSKGLSFEEASQIIGPFIEFRIPKVAATQVEVIGILPKTILDFRF